MLDELMPGHAIWIGVFQVVATSASRFLDGDAGAFVWAAAQATGAQHFQARVKCTVEDLGLELLDGEQIQEVTDEDLLSDTLWELLPAAKRDPEAVVYGTWHRFKHWDA